MPRKKAHPLESSEMGKKSTEANINGFTRGKTDVRLKDLAKIVEASPIERALSAEKPQDEGPRTSILELATNAEEEAVESDEETLKPLSLMTKRLVSKEHVWALGDLSDIEIKCIALLKTEYEPDPNRKLLDCAMENLMQLRVSKDRQSRTAFEKIMEAVGAAREDLANNPIKALFDRMVKKP